MGAALCSQLQAPANIRAEDICTSRYDTAYRNAYTVLRSQEPCNAEATHLTG